MALKEDKFRAHMVQWNVSKSHGIGRRAPQSNGLVGATPDSLIHGEPEESEHWAKRLAESGGEDAVAKEWIEAIENALSKLSPDLEEE